MPVTLSTEYLLASSLSILASSLAPQISQALSFIPSLANVGSKITFQSPYLCGAASFARNSSGMVPLNCPPSTSTFASSL